MAAPFVPVNSCRSYLRMTWKNRPTNSAGRIIRFRHDADECDGEQRERNDASSLSYSASAINADCEHHRSDGERSRQSLRAVDALDQAPADCCYGCTGTTRTGAPETNCTVTASRLPSVGETNGHWSDVGWSGDATNQRKVAGPTLVGPRPTRISRVIIGTPVLSPTTVIGRSR